MICTLACSMYDETQKYTQPPLDRGWDIQKAGAEPGSTFSLFGLELRTIEEKGVHMRADVGEERALFAYIYIY